MKEGVFIVIYGINNLGKSTQAQLLVGGLNKSGLKAEYLKYPIYDLKPTGPALNSALRQGQKLPAKELQTLYAKNRLDFQPQLIKLINDGVNVVAEDYLGTGFAWGMAEGLSFEEMQEINKGLLKPDIEILLDGERFLEAKEVNHHFESNDALQEQCRKIHLELAAKFGWVVVNANQSIEEVQQDILKVIEERLKEFK